MAKVKLDRVLVATDGSPESVRAAEFAALLTRGTRAKITVVHVIPNPMIPLGTTIIDDTSLEPPDDVVVKKSLWEGAQAILDRAMRPFQELGARVEGLVEASDDPADALIHLAGREGFDLIVVASHGKGAVERAILGSVSEALVRNAPCPVLLVRRGRVN
jgi:nucleotide-binding universal stress UspA family protein